MLQFYELTNILRKRLSINRYTTTKLLVFHNNHLLTSIEGIGNIWLKPYIEGKFISEKPYHQVFGQRFFFVNHIKSVNDYEIIALYVSDNNAIKLCLRCKMCEVHRRMVPARQSYKMIFRTNSIRNGLNKAFLNTHTQQLRCHRIPITDIHFSDLIIQTTIS